MVTIAAIRAAARTGGWTDAATERALRMAELLASVASHPDVRDALALKGGTALNAIDHDMPRLSVDLDFDYVGSVSRDDMLAARPVIGAALDAIAARHAMPIRRAADDHGGTTWLLTYRGLTGSGVVEIDVNWLRRSPIAPPRRVDATILGEVEIRHALIAASTELTAGKLVALLDRCRARDVWDARLLAESGAFDDPLLRLVFTAQLAGARRPWRKLLDAPIHLDRREAERQLLPLLRRREQPADVDAWSVALVDAVTELVELLRSTDSRTAAFLDAVSVDGLIDPTLLGIEVDDPMHARITQSPALQWKVQHVRAR